MSQPRKEKSDPADKLIQQFREYEVLKVLGKGGMGLVYLVRHSLTKRVEVLKVLRPSLSSNTRLRERFLREVEVAAKLDHPHVVKTLTAIQSGDVIGLVMEYVEGNNLETLVKHSGPLTVPVAAQVFAQVAQGLQHASTRGLIHRDIKPSNILLSAKSGTLVAKLSDFGLSKLEDETSHNGLTIDGRVLGTPDYMAPEQCLDPASATTAADVYGLGCSLYFALTGRPPYAGAGAMAILNQHINAPIPSVLEQRHDVPQGLNQVLQMMLQKDPRARMASPQAVADALLPYTSNNAQPPSPLLGANSAASVTAAVSQQTPTSYSMSNTDGTAGTGSVENWQSTIVAATRASKRKAQSKSKSMWPVLLQLLMPIPFIAFAYYYIILPGQRATDGTLKITNLPENAVVEIDDQPSDTSSAKNSMVEYQLPVGNYRVEVTDNGRSIADKFVEIRGNASFELSLPPLALSQRDRRPPPPPPVDRDPKPPTETTDGPTPEDVANGSDPPLVPPVEPPSPEPTPPAAPQSASPKIVLASSNYSIELERQLIGLKRSPSGLIILPGGLEGDGNELVIATGYLFTAWESKSGSELDVVPPFPLTGISISSNAKWALYFDEYRGEVWGARMPQRSKYWASPTTSKIQRIFALSSDSKYVVSVDHNETYSRLELASKKGDTVTAKHPLGNVKSVQLTPKLDKVVTLAQDETLACWGTDDGGELGKAQPSSDPADGRIINVHLSNNAKRALIVRSKGSLQIRSMPKLELETSIKVNEERLVDSAIGGSTLATVNVSQVVQLTDTTDFKTIGYVQAPSDATTDRLAISADGKSIAIGYSTGQVQYLRLRKLPSAARPADSSPPGSGKGLNP